MNRAILVPKHNRPTQTRTIQKSQASVIMLLRLLRFSWATNGPLFVELFEPILYCHVGGYYPWVWEICNWSEVPSYSGCLSLKIQTDKVKTTIDGKWVDTNHYISNPVRPHTTLVIAFAFAFASASAFVSLTTAGHCGMERVLRGETKSIGQSWNLAIQVKKSKCPLVYPHIKNWIHVSLLV